MRQREEEEEEEGEKKKKKLLVISLCLLSSKVVFGDRAVFCPGGMNKRLWQMKERKGLKNRNIFILQTSQQMLFSAVNLWFHFQAAEQVLACSAKCT